jgi:hypothetical protein
VLVLRQGVGSTICSADRTHFLRLPLAEGEVRGHFWQDAAIDANTISPPPRMLPIATILRNGGNSSVLGAPDLVIEVLSPAGATRRIQRESRRLYSGYAANHPHLSTPLAA